MQNITLEIIIFGVSWHLQLIKLRTANQKRKSNRMEKTLHKGVKCKFVRSGKISVFLPFASWARKREISTSLTI